MQSGRGVAAGDDRARSGRHRRGALARLGAATSDWYRQPHDHHWILTHRSTRPLEPVIRAVFAAATLMYATTSVLMLFSELGPRGPIALTWVLFVLVVQLIVAARWSVKPIPPTWFFIFFGFFGDVVSVSVMMLYEPLGSFIGLVLLVLTGAFCTYFLSPKLLVAHLVFATAVIVWFGIRIYVDRVVDTAAVLTATIVMLGAVVGVPVFAHVAWTALSNDAKRSVLDPLTGVSNRRGIDDELADLWHDAQSAGNSVAFIVIDIDKFKTVNDRFGHGRGDEVIVRIADRLRERLGRRGGVLARTGGEEFLYALHGDAREVVDEGFEIVSLLHDPGDDIPVTVSVGIALLRGNSELWDVGPSTVGRAARSADSAMYRSKQAGGNRAVVVEL